MSVDAMNTIGNIGGRTLEVTHRLVQRAIRERTQQLLEEVPGLLEAEAEQVVREGIAFEAREGRVSETSICDPWGRVRHSPLDKTRAAELVEQRLIMPHLESIERIYAQVCHDMAALGLDFDVLQSYRQRRIFDEYRCKCQSCDTQKL
jgi:hypothetical protein